MWHVLSLSSQLYGLEHLSTEKSNNLPKVTQPVIDMETVSESGI